MEHLGKTCLEQALRFWWLLALAEGALVHGWATRSLSPWPLIALCAALALLLCLPAATRMLRTLRRLASFQFADDERFSLWYASELEGTFDVGRFLQLCGEVLAELEAQFGFALSRHRIVVGVLPTAEELSELVGEEFIGAASPRTKSIVVAFDAMPTEALTRELLRHELGHLFVARLGPGRPHFKTEGLCRWLQYTLRGRPLDLDAMAHLLGEHSFSLVLLLERPAFEMDRNSSYAVAGSFTGYLIREYGWETYLGFYRMAGRKNYEAAFRKCFGVDVLDAEQSWREDLLSRRESFGPELDRAVHRRRAEGAYDRLNYYTALNELDRVFDTRLATGEDYELAALCHANLSHHQEAAEMLERGLVVPLEVARDTRAATWLHLGNMRDLLGERGKALECYRQCLKQPDLEFESKAWVHERARKCLNRPYSRQEFREQWQE